MNLYAYSGNNPTTFTDPFGLCPPQDDEQGPQCNRVFFLGLGGTLSVGGGVTGAVGVTYAKGEGLGVYARGGAVAGLDLGAAVEFGTSTSRRSFEGPSVENCDAVGVGGCFSANKAGYTANVVVGKANPAAPVAVHAGGTYTTSATWRDLKEAARQFIRQGLDAALWNAGILR